MGLCGGRGGGRTGGGGGEKRRIGEGDPTWSITALHGQAMQAGIVNVERTSASVERLDGGPLWLAGGKSEEV